MIARLATGLAAIALVAGAALAQGVAGEDFESGLGERWRGDPGRGDIRVTEYAGNHTLRLRREAWAATVIPLEGRRGVRVSASFAADDLEGTDACLLETSIDGETWQEAGRIVDGQDDSVTLHRIGVPVPDADGRDWIAVRLRIDGNGSNDTCWADDLRVDAAPEAPDMDSEIPAGDAPLERPLSASAFAAPDEAGPAGELSGRLHLSARASADGHRIHHDEFGYGDAVGIFAIPALDVGLATHDGILQPVERGPRPGDSAHWEWVVQPGRIWRDGETWRARLPVALQERNANCIHTGWLAVDLPPGGGETTGVLEIGAETCAYFRFDLWSRVEARFTPGDAPVAPAPEPAGLTRRPVEALAEAFPGTDPSAFGSPLEVAPEAMTVYGLLVDDVLYAGGCATRFGRDPYCEALPLPSYSLAKTLVAGLALMRLERLHPGARQARIADFVPACTGDRWAGVTFEHALDMATGLYTDDGFEVDESAPELWAFMTRTTHEGRIAQACAQHPRQSEPGTRWVYHTTDTYVLGTALQAFWHARTGRADADFYDDLLVPLWRTLGLSPLMDTTRRSYDAERQPVGGWGLTMTLDDMMKLGRFLQGGARLDGEAWADPAMMTEALQRDPADRGLPAGGEGQRYQNGVWAWNAGPALGCTEDAWIPALSGYGGITLALIPNGHVYAYVSDGREFAWRRAAAESNSIEPFCEVQP